MLVGTARCAVRAHTRCVFAASIAADAAARQSLPFWKALPRVICVIDIQHKTSIRQILAGNNSRAAGRSKASLCLTDAVPLGTITKARSREAEITLEYTDAPITEPPVSADTMACPLCGHVLPKDAEACDQCDWVRAPDTETAEGKASDAVAVMLSVIPGLGHVYKGYKMLGLLFRYRRVRCHPAWGTGSDGHRGIRPRLDPDLLVRGHVPCLWNRGPGRADGEGRRRRILDALLRLAKNPGEAAVGRFDPRRGVLLIALDDRFEKRRVLVRVRQETNVPRLIDQRESESDPP